MKIIVVGAGASGVAAAINCKRNHPSDDVVILEHLDKPLKKILATGNGKCNLGNANINFSLYNNPEFAEKVIKGYDYAKFFDSISIKTKVINDLAYPVSESAVSVRDALLKECNKLGIKILTEESLVDYTCNSTISVKTNKNTYTCDKLILAGGAKSSPKLGSDGSVLSILSKHGYTIVNPSAGLSPLYTVEKTKVLDGIRCKANVKVLDGKSLVHEEQGEVLFKEHGLSGIVIFNICSVIARKGNKKVSIYLDLLPDYLEDQLLDYYKEHGIDDFLQAFINPKIANYLKDRFHNDTELVKSVKALMFTFDKSYGFDFSQVTVGGVSVNEVDDNMMSKKEHNVYLIGELLDIDGPCGGYNLTWAFASALKVK